ncbi:hypothetical protein [Actinosynnema pretiosum]|uniref:Uncharacterized protein n=1 Tax=Actinosynnema pretiosum TaxID=42197 RepID=A0A290Z5L3_9PSEU|nr:hypothetical protein [Actinosynnema pretiosum]ATE54296.1 hypothetical protein CNX65_14170 [Actinosynnema pretiosum]
MDWERTGAVAGVVSAALAVMGLGVALVAWLLPRSADAPSPEVASTSAAGGRTTTGGAATTTGGAATTTAAYSEVYRDKALVLPTGALGVSAYVDLDKPSVRSAGSPAPEAVENSAEFSHTADDEFSTTVTDERARVGFAGGATTPEQCSDAATTGPISRKEKVGPGTNVDVGTRLCAVTGEGAVVLVEVVAIGPDNVFSRSITLRATLWKR